MKHVYTSFLTFTLLIFTATGVYAQGPNESGTYYAAADGKKGAELKTALCGIIYNRTERTYGDLWTDFKTTDKRADGKVWDMYSGISNYTFGTDQAGNYSGEGEQNGGKYNREHSFPKSWFGASKTEIPPMYTDLFHLYPTDGYVNSSEASFNDILNSSITDVTNALNDAQNTLDDLRKPFDDINNEIGDKVTDYSDKIDKYGKLVVKLVFSILMVMNIFLGVFIALIGLCSMKACADCCFCRCLFKSALHILWNILALMMILSFIVGSMLALVGRVGADAMSLISFVISAENFANNDPLLLGELGDAKKYLEICLHGNGSLESEFDLGDSLDYIEDIDRVFDGSF